MVENINKEKYLLIKNILNHLYIFMPKYISNISPVFHVVGLISDNYYAVMCVVCLCHRKLVIKLWFMALNNQMDKDGIRHH